MDQSMSDTKEFPSTSSEKPTEEGLKKTRICEEEDQDVSLDKRERSSKVAVDEQKDKIPSTSSGEPFEEGLEKKRIGEEEDQDISQDKRLNALEMSKQDVVEERKDKEQKDDFRPGTSSATSNYKSTGETTNHSRIERILGGPCTGAMQDVLSKEISPLNLLKEVEDHIKKYNLQGKKTAYNDIENKLNIKMNYSEFDITSIYFVLRNICKIKAHSNGWGNDPDVQDKALSAKIDRLRSLKNKYKSHAPKIIIIDDEYEKLCDEIFEIVRHLENILGKSTRYQTVVQWMKTCTMDPEQKIEHEKEKEEIEEKQITWKEKITSTELAKIFRSFNEDFPIDDQSRSFLRNLLNADILHKLQTHMESLANHQHVILTIDCNQGADAKDMHVYVFPVDVDDDRKKINVVEKVDRKYGFFQLNNNAHARVILIKGKDAIIKSKLAVYEEYKDTIDCNGILLHHEYEEFNEVAKFGAYKKVSTYCHFIESAINTLRTECNRFPKGQTNITKTETAWTLEIERIWEEWVTKAMNKSNSSNETFQKTEEALTDIFKKLKVFQAKIRPDDQNELLKYWLRGDILQNRSEIEKNKYIRKYIVGHRDDKEKPVAKVFLSRDDEDAKELFKSCCKNRDNIEFEFILQSKEEGDEIVSEKTNTKTLNTEERKELRKFVRSNTNKIFATYSTVVLVSASTDCILICCLDKTLIPFGEKKLPEFLEGWPCDVREGIPLLNISCNNCKASKPNSVEAGCSIGIPSTVNSGSVGFFVEPRKKMHTFECGFLTACHVAINDFDKLYQYNELLSESPLGENKHVIVHPSTGDNNIIGEVFESFIGNFGLSGTGLDLAVVKTYSSPEKGEKETLDVIKEDDLDFGEYITVKKCGNTTGTTFGYLSDCALSVRVNSPLSSNMLLKFDNCYAVKNIDVPFFKEGDSGAGVFVVQNDGTLKPLGIAFSSLGPMTIVCKIDDFLDKLDLQIVRYEENTTESMESV